MKPISRNLALSVAVAVAGSSLIWGSAAFAAEGDLDQVRRRRATVQSELDRTVARYENAEDRLTHTQDEIAELNVRISEAEQQLAQVQTAIAERANILYRRGPASFLLALLEAGDASEFFRGLALMERATGGDSAVLLKASRLKEDLAARRSDLEARRADEAALLKSLKGLTSDLESKLREAGALEKRLLDQRAEADRRRREEAARAARAAAAARRIGVGISGFVCPMDGPHSFRDTWGAPRSGGRRHQGVDIFAAHGTPIVAVVAGVITRTSSSSLGGVSLYMRGDDNTEYFYTHLAGYAGVSPGQRVSAGQRVAYNGNSGNARGGPAHLHFEIHPGGGAPVNPYPTVKAACG